MKTQENSIPSPANYPRKSLWIKDLLSIAGISQADIVKKTRRSKGMISRVISGDVKSRPVEDCIFYILKEKLADFPYKKQDLWSYDEKP